METVGVLLKVRIWKKYSFRFWVRYFYNCNSEQMVYGNYIPHRNKIEKSSGSSRVERSDLLFRSAVPYAWGTSTQSNGHWSFPHWWCFWSSCSLRILCLIFKQRRLSEIQKDFINNMTYWVQTPISTIAISAEVLKIPDTAHHPERLFELCNHHSKWEQPGCGNRLISVAGSAPGQRKCKLKVGSLNIESIVREAVNNFDLVFERKEWYNWFNGNSQSTHGERR